MNEQSETYDFLSLIHDPDFRKSFESEYSDFLSSEEAKLIFEISEQIFQAVIDEDDFKKHRIEYSKEKKKIPQKKIITAKLIATILEKIEEN